MGVTVRPEKGATARPSVSISWPAPASTAAVRGGLPMPGMVIAPETTLPA